MPFVDNDFAGGAVKQCGSCGSEPRSCVVRIRPKVDNPVGEKRGALRFESTTAASGDYDRAAVSSPCSRGDQCQRTGLALVEMNIVDGGSKLN